MNLLTKILHKPFSLLEAHRNEREHQEGRLANWKQIIAEISDKNIKGDFIEFGSYQGKSLAMLTKLMQEAGMKRNLIGIDSFAGLEEDEFPFRKGWFTDASKELCQFNAPNAEVLEYNFAQKDEIVKALGDKKFCFIHIDCDLSSAVRLIFQFLPQIMNDTCYLCFDDYNVMESYKNTVNELLNSLNRTVVNHSHTKLTRNFLIIK